ncbi:MAG: PAS domain S-box protein [Cyanobacteria bacterium J06588_5]
MINFLLISNSLALLSLVAICGYYMREVKRRTAALVIANTMLQTEIAERKRAEMVLRHKHDTLNALIIASPRAIALLGTDGTVKIWNPAAEAMFGWQPTEVIDQPSPILLGAFTADNERLIQSVLQGCTHLGLELQCRHKDGTAVEVMCSVAPLRDPAGNMAENTVGESAESSVDNKHNAGNISGLVAVMVDITAQRQQAEELRLLQSVVVNTNDAVIITEAEPFDEPGPRILYVNDAFTQITGYQPEEVLGKTPRILQGPKTDRT